MPEQTMVIGLTGGIGSGKTAVSDRFALKGIAIVDADIASRTVVEPGKPALAEIAAHFGDEVILESGELNRAKLREIVFADPSQREQLEAMTHPRIRDEIVSGLQSARSPYVILASPLLMETDQHQMCDRILLVDVPEDIQLQRASSRDGVSVEQIKAIMAAQTSREKRRQNADDIIVNDRDLNWLDEEVERLHSSYLSLCQS
ncbi:dephospho-CoA kinase [Pseudoteredinibacter isoporae]|uniref:Dephospho-CoA kinase n=1 Tax=Pseudoteredinibacter isoporae TaxID=570281 RepID=A0A7X0JWI5_9GAMM|nr:dephospho-CoA kinase [Pseudoteredinibacter isoporae]MBB6522716.1 dephospho-CoA kinase [Pseudoteredinibacter isoporae]NHO88246.1 dephospho-CoA kinase [Pseudoteredinibacter isoporae]NIB23423.1 dephospho-CoA kinase [Pseudoteredinibacter isoporae]